MNAEDSRICISGNRPLAFFGSLNISRNGSLKLGDGGVFDNLWIGEGAELVVWSYVTLGFLTGGRKGDFVSLGKRSSLIIKGSTLFQCENLTVGVGSNLTIEANHQIGALHVEPESKLHLHGISDINTWKDIDWESIWLGKGSEVVITFIQMQLGHVNVGIGGGLYIEKNSEDQRMVGTFVELNVEARGTMKVFGNMLILHALKIEVWEDGFLQLSSATKSAELRIDQLIVGNGASLLLSVNSDHNHIGSVTVANHSFCHVYA